MKKAFSIALVSIALAATPCAHATGVPTVDAVLNGTAIGQLMQLYEQYKTLKDQYSQLQATHAAMTGSRGLGSIFYNPALKGMLPPDMTKVYDAVKGGGYAGISGSIKDILKKEKFSGSIDDMQTSIQDRQRDSAATDKAVGLKAYDSALARLSTIENLMNAVSGTNDVKAAEEIVGRIGAEQAAMQNEQTKLQLIGMLQQSERNLIQEQKRDMNRRILSTSNSAMPTIK